MRGPWPITGAASPSAEPAIVVDHLVRRFGGRVILQDVSFTVAPGLAFGIAAANGAGKTVLLRLIASLDRPTAGRITIHGYDTIRRARAVRDRIGYVPEEPMLYDGLTAEQYLQFVGHARGLGKQVRQVAVDTLLQVVGLEERRWREVSAFSPGERRRLALASALVHEPDVLLLDDPLRGLDGFARLEQIEVLRELHRLGSTMLVAATRPRIYSRFATLSRSCATAAWYGAATPARPPPWQGRSTRTPSGYALSSSKAWMRASPSWASDATSASWRSTKTAATSGSCSLATTRPWPTCCPN